MPFRNNILAGVTLVRDAIQSQGFQAGVTGWRISKNGNAEFNDATLRGSLLVDDGTESILIDNNTFGFPSIAFFFASLASPAGINAYDVPAVTGTSAHVGLLIQAGPNTVDGKSMLHSIDDLGMDMGYGNIPGDGPYFRLEQRTDISLYAATMASDRTLNSGVKNEIVINQDNLITTLGAGTFRITYGDVENFPLRVVDGKTIASGGPVDTTSASTTPVSLGSGNAQNTPLIQNHVYMGILCVRVTSSVAADRAEFTLWDGTVGSSNQLGSNRIVKIAGTAAQQEDQTLLFFWKQGSTTTLSNLNVGVARFSGTGTITARVDNAAYTLAVVDLSLSGVISNL